MNSTTIHIRFGESVAPVVQRRLTWAFRLFCVGAGHTVASGEREADLVLAYGAPPGPGELGLSCSYVPRNASQPAPEPTHALPTMTGGGLRAIPCFHPVGDDGAPDLLGEIFEWMSGDHERSVHSSDQVGRVPFNDTLHGRYGISPRVAWATEAMRWLEASVQSATGAGPVAPVVLRGPLGRTVIAATHDLDFLPGHVVQTSKRYGKNLLRSVARRDPALAAQIALAGVGAIRGENPLDTLMPMLRRERELGIHSSVNVLCRTAHRRDANYILQELRTRDALELIADNGAEIGLHGSYTSLAAPGRLASEYEALAAAGYVARGGRQHWLRYRGDVLFKELVRAGALYDSTIAYPDQPGFRFGASFPFPPWDFGQEAPYPLLQIPLAIMDASLVDHADGAALAREVIDEATRHSWGGSAILWHDTVFGGSQLSREIADLYWELKQPDHDWGRAIDMVDELWPVYAAAGLVPDRSTIQPATTAVRAAL